MTRDQRGQLLEPVFEHRLEAEHEADPVHDRGARPGLEALRGRSHRRIDLTPVRQGYLLDHFGGGWMEDRKPPDVLSRQAPFRPDQAATQPLIPYSRSLRRHRSRTRTPPAR